MMSREVAKRMFAYEIIGSVVSFKSDENDQYSPVYILTPTGEKCSRIFMIARVVSKESVGNDDIRMKVEDSTTSIYVYVSGYNPSAITAVADINAGDYIAIVGKPVIYRLSNGDQFVYIRATDVNKSNENDYKYWKAETALQTYNRLACIDNDEDRRHIACGLYSINKEDYFAVCRNAVGGV